MKVKNFFFYTIIIVITAWFSFSVMFNTLIGEFEKQAMSKMQLIWEHIEINTSFINMLAIQGELFFEYGQGAESAYYDLLEYDSITDTFDLESIGNTEDKKFLGNITGMGPIPKSGLAKADLNLAFKYNAYFSHFYNRFKDATWLYYTSENNFINIYPWVSADAYRFREDTKSNPYYSIAIPQNNRERVSKWTPVYFDEVGMGLMVTLSEPVYYKDLFMGVVSVDYTNDQLSALLGSEYESFLIDPSGNVLASNKENLTDDSIVNLKALYQLSDLNFTKLMNMEHNKIERIGNRFVYAAIFENAPWRMYVTINVWKVMGLSMLPLIPISIIGGLMAHAFGQNAMRKKSEISLKAERELFNTTLQTLHEGIIVTDTAGKITLMNKAAERMTGWKNEEALGVLFAKVFINMNLITREPGRNPVQMVLEEHRESHSPRYIGLVSRDGSEYYITGSAKAIYAENATMSGVVVSFTDVTLEHEQESEIRAFLEINLDMLCVLDTDGNFVKVNKKFEDILGYTSEELVNQKFISFVHKMDFEETKQVTETLRSNNPVMGFTNRFRTKNGYYKYIEWYTQPSHNRYFYSSARDVTERFVNKLKLEKAALKDKLTGVYNRHYLDMIIEREIKNAEQNNNALTMVMVDLDFFKVVNDTWGHPVGDIVLKQIAQVISAGIRNSDVLVRFGGEEFVILMPNTTQEGALAASEKIRQDIENHAFPIEGKLTASFGVSEHVDQETFLEWYYKLDEALYRAKGNGRNCVSL